MATYINDVAPARDYFAITPSDSVNFAIGAVRGIYVGGAGNIVAVSPLGSAITFVGVLPGTVLQINAVRINASLTTATQLVGLL